PSGKAAGFGPAIPGSNPGAPALTGRLAAVVMAAGQGTRMKSATPKHLHPLLGRRLADWAVEAVRPLGVKPLVVVASPAAADAFDGVIVAVQHEPLGTGDAVRSAKPFVGDADAVLIVSADHPLLTPGLLRRLVDEHRDSDASATVLSFEPADPRAYGRVVRNGNGSLEAIVEARDATEEQLAIREVNSSIYEIGRASCRERVEMWEGGGSVERER